MRHTLGMTPLWFALLLAQAPHLVQHPPTRLDQCEELKVPTHALDEHVAQCDGRYYLDGELAGVGSKADLDRWLKQRAQIANRTFHSGEGFGKVKWGASPEEVRRAYPKAKGKGALEVREAVDGLPATVRFVFVDSQLAAVRVQFAAHPSGTGSGEAMDEVKKKLEKSLGPSEDGKWDTPATRIDLSFANVGEAVAVRVDYESRELTFLSAPQNPVSPGVEPRSP
jgi:hypothetical protein